MEPGKGGAAVHKPASPLYKGSQEKDKSQGGTAVHEPASLLYKGSNEEEHNLQCDCHTMTRNNNCVCVYM